MKALNQAALVNSNLVPITGTDMVGRYRDCMIRLGLEPTKRKKFSVDAIGWSPEIAEEMEDTDYLSHGGAANPLGIIVDIDQAGSSVYAPSHSFDQVMMRDYYRVNRSAVADLTTQCGIALDLDQRMTWYRTLDHVCSVRSVHIISDGGDLSDRAAEQSKLTDSFLDNDSNAWMDHKLREHIIASLQENGELYKRRLVIGEHIFSSFDDYYTKALGGVYVLRHNGTLALVVTVDEKQKKNASKDLQSQVTSLTDKDVVARVRDAGIADIDFTWYHEHPAVLRSRLAALCNFVLTAQDPELPVDSLRSAQLTGALRLADPKQLETYAEFEEVVAKVGAGEQVGDMSPAVTALMLHPIATSTRYEENLVWRLITQLQPWPVDVMRLYAVDKNLFLKQWSGWSDPMQKWVINQIRSYNSAKTYDPI